MEKLPVALFSILLLVGALYMYGKEREGFLLNTAPVDLGTVKRLKVDHRGKGPPTYHAFLQLHSLATTDSLVEVKVDKQHFQRLHPADTLAVRYSTQTRQGSVVPEPAPKLWHWLLGGGLFFAGTLLPTQWKARLRPPHRPFLWHCVALLFGGSLMCFGLKGCARWAGSYSYLRPYHHGHHVQGRVMVVSPIDTSSLVLVAFHPREDSVGAAPYTRWMPATPFYRDMFFQANQLGWKPEVDVWYPDYGKEKAHLLSTLRPDEADDLQAQYFFMLMSGFIIFIVQINPLEKLLRRET